METTPIPTPDVPATYDLPDLAGPPLSPPPTRNRARHVAEVAATPAASTWRWFRTGTWRARLAVIVGALLVVGLSVIATSRIHTDDTPPVTLPAAPAPTTTDPWGSRTPTAAEQDAGMYVSKEGAKKACVTDSAGHVACTGFDPFATTPPKCAPTDNGGVACQVRADTVPSIDSNKCPAGSVKGPNNSSYSVTCYTVPDGMTLTADGSARWDGLPTGETAKVTVRTGTDGTQQVTLGGLAKSGTQGQAATPAPTSTGTPTGSPSAAQGGPVAASRADIERMASDCTSTWLASAGMTTQERRAALAPYAGGRLLDDLAGKGPEGGSYSAGVAVQKSTAVDDRTVVVSLSPRGDAWRYTAGSTPDGARLVSVTGK